MPKPTEASFLEIDQDRLDQEWLKQPLLAYEYGVKLADARREADTAKTAVDLAMAGADKDVRDRPSKYGIDKITESAVAAAVKSHRTVQQAVALLSNAQHAVAVLSAANTAIDHRKRALENLVDLHGQGYFATPRAGNEAAREHVEKAVKSDVRVPTKRRVL